MKHANEGYIAVHNGIMTACKCGWSYHAKGLTQAIARKKAQEAYKAHKSVPALGVCEMCGEETQGMDTFGHIICKTCFAQSQIEDAEFNECDW